MRRSLKTQPFSALSLERRAARRQEETKRGPAVAALNLRAQLGVSDGAPHPPLLPGKGRMKPGRERPNGCSRSPGCLLTGRFGQKDGNQRVASWAHLGRKLILGLVIFIHRVLETGHSPFDPLRRKGDPACSISSWKSRVVPICLLLTCLASETLRPPTVLSFPEAKRTRNWVYMLHRWRFRNKKGRLLGSAVLPHF